MGSTRPSVRHLAFVGLVLVLFALSGASVRAQSAFDSACYYPVVGDPNGLDSIYGSYSKQHLGADMFSLPPIRGKQYPRLYMSGVTKHAPFISQMETGPTFDLHHLNITKDVSSTPYQWATDIGYGYRWGHFRSPKYLDLIIYYGFGDHPIIYWADENGEFDSSRTTRVLPGRIGSNGISCRAITPYIAKITSDTVDDIVLAAEIGNDSTIISDRIIICLVKGGHQLFDQGRVAVWDDTAYWMTRVRKEGIEDITNRQYGATADFRGVGRDDYICGDDWGNIYYYKNDLPFDLKKFASSLSNDTLLVLNQYSLYAPPPPSNECKYSSRRHQHHRHNLQT